MSLEADIFAVLGPLFSGRVFPDVAPLNTQRPYATWQQVGGQELTCVDQLVPDLKHARIQVDVWSSTRLEAASLMRDVAAAMTLASLFTSRPDGAMRSTSWDEVEPRLYGAQQDFSTWYGT